MPLSGEGLEILAKSAQNLGELRVPPMIRVPLGQELPVDLIGLLESLSDAHSADKVSHYEFQRSLAYLDELHDEASIDGTVTALDLECTKGGDINLIIWDE